MPAFVVHTNLPKAAIPEKILPELTTMVAELVGKSAEVSENRES